jgi:hypothetical protein
VSTLRLWIPLEKKAPLKIEAEGRSGLPESVPTAAGERRLHLELCTPASGLLGCLACGHQELYTQKDFPRSAGIAIVVAAALLAPATRYASLAIAALLDALLYAVARDVVLCYVCSTRHRGFAREPRHPRFDREIAERLLYGKRAVMGKPMRPGGTAGAPDPEH